MSAAKDPSDTPLDDRVAFQIAEAVVATIAQRSPRFQGEEDVWDAILARKGPELSLYLETIRRTRHSIFLNQLQELYEFGKECVPRATADDFLVVSGRELG